MCSEAFGSLWLSLALLAWCSVAFGWKLPKKDNLTALEKYPGRFGKIFLENPVPGDRNQNYKCGIWFVAAAASWIQSIVKTIWLLLQMQPSVGAVFTDAVQTIVCSMHFFKGHKKSWTQFRQCDKYVKRKWMTIMRSSSCVCAISFNLVFMIAKLISL